MAIVNGDIVNLINGVSQQAASLRLPTQGELQRNMYSTIVEGLKKRPPLEHLAKLLDSVPEDAYFHIIQRDLDERYIAIFTKEGVSVYDFDGDAKTVTIDGDAGDYLAAAVSAKENFKALTVADYTFLVNNKVECAMDDTNIEPLRHPEALINIKAGNYARTYQIKIDGVLVAEYTTPDGSNSAHAANIATTVIAVELYNDLVLNGFDDGVTWGTGIHQNALHIVRWDDQDFTISMTDGVNGNASSLAKGEVQKFADLPLFAPQDFVIQVGNSDGTLMDNYWVKADKGGSDQNSQVVWKECCKPGTVLSIDPTTMPHALVRNEDGTFTFRAMEWDERKCGDGETISPDPSFIGSTISDITFFKNRLGFLTDEGIVLSRAGSFFDFFRTSATTILDDDPIDVSSAHIKVSFMRHALPFQDYLLLFSDETQFRLAGNETLTPKTVSIRPLTEFNCSRKVRPIACGQSSFFVSDTSNGGEYATVYEYFIDKSLETANADSVNAHCPSYIPAGATALTGSPDDNVLALLTNAAPDTIFAYSFYWAEKEKLQSSWSEWVFDDCAILNVAFAQSDLLVLYAKDGAVHLGKIRMDPSAFDEEFGFMANLDHRVRSTDLAAPSYDDQTDKTTYTLPYEAPETIRAVVSGGTGAIVGTERTVEIDEEGRVVLLGDTTGIEFLFGSTYESRYRFSRFYPRVPNQQGGTLTRQDGRLQLQHLTVIYDRSAFFKVEVARETHPVETHVFSGYVVGAPTSLINSIPIASGRFSVPLLSRNDRVTIDLVNDSWLPSNFVSASWRGRWTQKGREV